jgi:hypothetical protein
MNDFNLQKFLIENKMTRNSRLLTENYNVEPIKLILLSNSTPEDKMDDIGTFLTDTEEGYDLGNSNLGDIIDLWFDGKIKAGDGLMQIKHLIDNPGNIEDRSEDLM